MKRAGMLALWLSLGGLLFFTAYVCINTTFMFYDDEGYVLSTLRAFLEGGRLYDDVFTQYGPWPYLYHQLATTVINAPLTHMLGRSLTAFHWASCAILCGLIAKQLCRRGDVAIAAMAATFTLLWQMRSEPSHPGSHLSFLLGLTGLLIIRTPLSNRQGLLGVALGALAALLFLSKINVGLLLLAGLGGSALRFTSWPAAWHRPAAITATSALLILPWALMFKKLDESWPLVFAIQFSLAAASAIWVTPATGFGRPLAPRTWLGAAAGFAITCLLVSGAVCAQGTTVRALVEAVVISPLKHPARFMFGFSWFQSVWPLAIGCWLLSARAGWELRRRQCLSPITQGIIVAVRLCTLAAFIYHAGQWTTMAGVGQFMVFCLPVFPVFLIPLDPLPLAPSHRLAARWMLGFIALPQVLHAFPVAGSQMGWGTFLLIPLFAAGLVETLRVLITARFKRSPHITSAVWALVLALTGWQWWQLAAPAWKNYQTVRPLELPGAENIRLDGISRQTLRLLTLNAAVHTDILFSRPGMFSYNIWSGSQTPTSRNATHWFWLLSESEQHAIIAQLEKTPRRGIITNRILDQFMSDIAIPMDGPLQSHLLANYRGLFEHRDFSFLVPADSKAVPFGKIEHLEATAESADGSKNTVFRANLAIDGNPSSVALEQLNAPYTEHQRFRAPVSRVLLEPITSSGESLGPPLQLPTNQSLRGLYRLTIFHDTSVPSFPSNQTGLFVRDASGATIAEAVF